MVKETNSSKLDVMANDISYIKDDVKEIKLTLYSNYVTVERFNALKSRVSVLEKAVYGVIGLALITIFTAIFSGVLK